MGEARRVIDWGEAEMKAREDLVAGIILILFALFAYLETFFFSEVLTWTKVPGGRFSPTPSTWPRVVLAVLFFLSGVLAVSGFIHGKASVVRGKEAGAESVDPKNIFKALWFIILLFAYLLSMDTLGFALSTILLGVGFSFAIGRSDMRLWKAILTNLAIGVLVAVSFSRFLYVPFPKGAWIFRAFSEFILYQ